MRVRTKLLLPLLAVSALMTVASLLVLRHSVLVKMREEIAASLSNSARIFESLERHRAAAAEHSAELIANVPSLKAMMTTQDPSTIQDASQDIWRMAGVGLLALASPSGKIMALHSADPDLNAYEARTLFAPTLQSPESELDRRWWFAGGHIYEVFIMPVQAGPQGASTMLGLLAIGYEIDRQSAAEFARIASGQVAFRYDGRIVLSTMESEKEHALSVVADTIPATTSAVLTPPIELELAGERFLTMPLRLSAESQPDLELIIFKSYRPATTLLNQINGLIAAIGCISILFGGILVFMISDSVTRPLRDLVTGVRALDAGNFSYPLQSSGRDEIAELTRTFESMRRNMQLSQERLVTSARLEAIGQLAGGIAHDFNNLATIIAGYSDLLMVRLNEEDPAYAYVQQIRKAGDRAGALTRQLLTFSRKHVAEPQIVDMNAVVQNTSKMLRMLVGEHIELEIVNRAPFAKVFVDAAQMEQALMNLIINARDAMPDGGRITIQTEKVELTAMQASIEGEIPSGTYVRLSVTDTGSGMDAQTQQQIFQPFYTTKDLGKGTGLGLAIVYGVVKQCGGFIQVESQVGGGSTFILILPFIGNQQPKETEPRQQSCPRNGSGTVLVVEDEDAVRNLAREVLELHGYTVLDARDGTEALEVMKRFPARIDLLLTDVRMPRLDGPPLAENVRAISPGTRVLFMSGYTDKWHEIEQREESVVKKPFTPDVLADKVREAMAVV